MVVTLQMLVQGEKRHRVLERHAAQAGHQRDGFLAVLRSDTLYARYQLHQFTSGMANMMLEPPLVNLVSKQLGASGLSAWVFLVSAAMGVMAWRGFDKLRKDVRERPLRR